MASSGADAYRLGREYSVMPIPMNPANCVDVEAGPVTFVVEARQLRPEDVIDHAAGLGKLDAIDDVSGVDDSGISVHVVDPATGDEHLRFDCFEHEPHYHYIQNDAGSNTVVRLDDVAEGDPHAWMLRTLRRRLPEMLAHAGPSELADRVRSAEDAVGRGIDDVERLLATLTSDA